MPTATEIAVKLAEKNARAEVRIKALREKLESDPNALNATELQTALAELERLLID